MTHTPSPKRPYLLRAYYDWLVDNDFTPYLVVDANYYGTNVPVEYVKDGQIVETIESKRLKEAVHPYTKALVEASV